MLKSKSGPDSKLHLEVPVGQPDTEFEVEVVVRPKAPQGEDGELTQLSGIAQHEECVVPASIHMLDIYIRDAGCQLTIPFCFAEGDAPLLIGREGFFDAFRIAFDKPQLVTVFELAKNAVEGSQ